MKKFFPLLAIVLFCISPVFSEENISTGAGYNQKNEILSSDYNQNDDSSINQTPSDFNFSISPKISYKSGMMNEYVFVYDDNGDVQKLSELNWEIKNLIRLGFDFTASYKAWDFKADFLFGIRNKNGTMRDSDWLNYTTEYDYIDPSIKTTYSISSLNLVNDIKAELSASYNFKSPYFSFSPYISFDYNYTEFSSFDTEGWHGEMHNPPVSWNSPDALHYPKGSLGDIEYTRESFCFYLGINNYTKISRVIFYFDFAFSPFIYVSSIDLHKFPGGTPAKYFLDKMYGFFDSAKLTIGGELFITDYSSFYLSFTGNLQNEISGKTQGSYDKKTWVTSYDSFPKSSGEYFEAVFGWKYKF